MNPMSSHPMTMDRMIFEFNASVHATSLYLIVCSYMDEGVEPTLNQVLEAWNGSDEDLVQAVKELSDFRILQPMEPMDFNRILYPNPREHWSWCKSAKELRTIN